jgi:N-(5-amino-5-carboxypentanoyl)-L-cysteinyl-D-valine synthase
MLTMRYAPELFDTMVIDSFLSALCTLMEAIAHPGRTLADIELLLAAQVEQMDAWNSTDGSYPTEKRLHHLFEEAAERSNDKVAVIFGERRVTYRDLNELANLMAHHIHSIGVVPEQLVGLFLDKSEKMIATILGVWKSGAAHVPIDPAYPNDRVRFVLDDSETRVIIASRRHVQRLQNEVVEDRDIKIISLEPLLDSLLEQGRQWRERTQNPASLSLTSKQLAYVTYTLGTTGFPKRIYKEHTSVVNSITDLSLKYGVAQGDNEVILLFSANVFEPFVRQMLMALTTGHRLAIINDEDKYDPDTLLPFIQAHSVTYLNGTASVIQEYDFTACISLKRIILVGENLTDARYKALRRRFRARIFNEYGFTESAFVTALNIFESDSVRTNMSLGQPVRNVKCYILDPSLKRVPLGVTGELHIGGLGISRGYMNRDELTRQKFLANPFQTDEERGRGVNGLMYKTGDLARWLPNGEVEYLGRADFQIKLRGIRIEPGEIEATLIMYPGVRTSIVVSKRLLNQGMETTQEALIGYFVCDEQELLEHDLLAFLETKLPRYMIPARLIQLQQIPVTINGKADLRALPAVEMSILPVASKGALPALLRDDIDLALGKIWADVLGVPFGHIDLDKSFFRLGGHSITCIQLIARDRHAFSKGITIEEVFQTKTLRAMSDLIRAKEEDTQGSAQTSHPASDAVSGMYIANSLQQGFVYHSLKTQESDAYIMQSCLTYKAKLDADLYKVAWESIYSRHPGLRLRFCWKDEVSQVVELDVNLDWRVLDWTQTVDEEARRLLLQRTQSEDRAAAYRLDEGPLSRLYFISLPFGHSLCFFSCHHSILDGWSLPLLFEYVHEAYLDLVSGHTLPLGHDPAYLQSQQYLQDHRDDHLEFWADQIGRIEERCDMNALLNEASRYKVPLGDYDQIQEQRQQTIELPWDKTMTSLRDECSSQGITLHSVLQLVWHLVLRAYGGGTHTITGTTISGQNLPVEGIERALGLFINTLPLVIDHELCSNKTVLEAIFHVQDQVNAMNSRGNVELGRVQKDDLKHGLFDTLFVLENYPNLDTSKRLRHQERLQYEIKGGTEKLSYPLAVIAQEDGNETCPFTLCYASELFTDETIHDLLHTVRDTFRTIAQNIGTPIRDIEYLSARQIEQLDKWNATVAEFPNCTLHSLFESEAQQKPDKIAVVYEDSRLSYQELNARANALSYYLIGQVPIRPNQLVALVMDKSEHMITSILAVWKTGGAYVPIDPSYPDDRISYILEDTAAVAIIGDEKYSGRLRVLRKESVPLVPSNLALQLPRSVVHPQSLSTPQDLAYVMYTSGTTGRPKGVMVEHHGVVNLAASLSQIFVLRDTDDEVILSFSNYVFDHFVEQMTDALLNGQTLLVLNDEMRGDKGRLYRYIAKNRVTYVSGTPSVISMYEFGQFHDHLRRIDCVGEAFSEPVFDKIRETFPGLVINGYGPTEVSITTHKRLYPYPERRTDKSIGKQVANSTSYVLNSDMKRVPIGAVGELFLGGDGVVRGCHNRPDLTEDRFPCNPFQSEQEKREGRNGRLYKTGDLVRWIQTADGEVEYLGRNDFQVKIRGQRIELGEIEAILSSFPGITQSVLLAKDRASDGQKYLVGYYVSPVSPAPQAIRRFMQTRLPVTLVPARLICINKFPVTVSEKLDSRALPVPDETVDEEVVAPRSEVERILVGI